MAERKKVKGEATRERIFEAAMVLYAEKGFATTTMREIAAVADCSLGLAYRYFETKEAMVITLYERLVAEFVEEATTLAPGNLATRWATATRSDFARLQRHRNALTGLTAAGLNIGSPTQVLGATNAPIRREMRSIFTALVTGAKDAPRPAVADALATLLYSLHLLLVLFWLQDPTPEQRTTFKLIEFGEEMFGRLRFLLRLPWAGSAIVRLGEILRPILDGSDSPP